MGQARSLPHGRHADQNADPNYSGLEGRFSSWQGDSPIQESETEAAVSRPLKGFVKT